MTTADPDEYVLDTATVRAFVASVRAAIANAASAAEACDAIRPAFADLLADPDWLAPEYARDAPESGMGGGIGQWLTVPRRRPVADPVLARRAARRADAGARPPRVGARRPVPRHAGRGDLRRRADRARAARAPRARPRGLLCAAAPARRHPPRAHDLARDVGVDPRADERHRVRVAPR